MTDSLDRQALNAAENVYRECDKCKVFLRSTEQESGAHLLLFRKGELQVPKGQLGMLKSLRCRLQSTKTLITHAKAG